MNKRELFIPGFLILLGWGLFIITAEDEKVSSKDDHPARTPNQLHEEENVPREPMFPTEPIEEDQDTETYGQQIIFNTVTPKGIPMNITAIRGEKLGEIAILRLTETFKEKSIDAQPGKVCPNCPINMDCYDEEISILRPSKCPLHDVTPNRLLECLHKTPILMFGDSRLYQMRDVIYNTLRNLTALKYQAIPNLYLSKHMMEKATERLLLTQIYEPPLAVKNLSVNALDESVARFETKPRVVIINKGAHDIIAENRDQTYKIRGVPGRKTVRDMYKMRLNNIFNWVDKFCHKDAKIVFMEEMYPLNDPEHIGHSQAYSASSEPRQCRSNAVCVDEASQLQWYRAANREEVAKRNILYWNSHLLADFEYYKICSETLTYRQMDPEFQTRFSCRDEWHFHHIYYEKIFIPQLFNEICEF